MAGIKSITVTNAGSGYTTLPTVAIGGTGGNIVQIDIDNPGSGYIGSHTHGKARGGSGTTIILDSSAPATNSYYNNGLVRITRGTGAGQTAKITGYVGATRTVTVAAFSTTPDTTSMYEIGPQVVFSGGGGSSAEAVATVRGGVIQEVTITNPGSSYETIPDISLIDCTGGSGNGAVLLAHVDQGSGASAEAVLTGTSIASVAVDNSPLPNSAGTPTAPKYTAPPTIVVKPSNGDQPTTTAVLDAVLTGTTISRINITNAGTGFTGTPTLTISGGGGSSGTATATVSSGSINSVSLTNAGSGYTSTPTITISGGGGSNATAEVVLTPTTVASVTVTNGGAGYTAPPTITAFPSQTRGDQTALLPPNRITPGVNIITTNGTSATAPGMACTLTPTMTATTLDSVRLTAFGAGYSTPPTITLTGGGGSGATATAELNAYNIKATTERTREGVKALVEKQRPPLEQVDTTGSYAASGGRVPQKLRVGQLAMMKGGLYRVTGVEALSFGQPLGLQGTVTSHSAGTTEFVIALDEPDSNLDTVTIPGGTKIIFGDGKIREVGTMNGSDVTLSGGSGTFTLTGALTKDADLGVDTAVRIQFIPGNSGSSTNFLLDEFTIDGLDTLSVGDNEVVYHVGFGLNYTPKYIAADGSFAKAGRSSTTEKTLTGVESSPAHQLSLGGVMYDEHGKLPDDSSHDGTSENQSLYDNFGAKTIGGAKKTFAGFTSARVRVFQPKGVPKFAAMAVGFKDDTSTVTDENGLLHNDALMINPTGFITANESPASQPNPSYMLWIGSGEETLPQFQAAANDEDIIDPRITFVGHKYSLRPVPEDEVRRMQKRSGGFKYEVIPYALDAYEGESLGRGNAGPAGPREGWSVHVKSHRGTPMNKAEYDNATNQATPMTNNMLNGASNRRNNRRRDPRSAHRRDY